MSEHMIGVSLSLCIKDMIEDKIKFSSVKSIIAGTRIVSKGDLEHIYDTYCQFYWKDKPTAARNMLFALWRAGKVIQPKVLGLDPLNISGGHWFELIA